MHFSPLFNSLLFKIYILSLIWIAPIQGENPWGKDADLVLCRPQPVCNTEPSLSPLRRLASALILFHQEVISPIDGPRSHFFPSSSQYAKESIQKHGFFLGIALGCDRLLRENDDPWVYTTCLSPDGRRLKVNLPP